MNTLVLALASVGLVCFTSGGASASEPLRTEIRTTSLMSGLIQLSNVSNDDRYLNCLQECKPESGGGEGNGMTRCVRECMERGGGQ